MQQKPPPWIRLEKGDTLHNQTIIKAELIQDKYSQNHIKILTLEDGTQYLADNDGIQLLEQEKRAAPKK